MEKGTKKDDTGFMQIVETNCRFWVLGEVSIAGGGGPIQELGINKF